MIAYKYFCWNKIYFKKAWIVIIMYNMKFNEAFFFIRVYSNWIFCISFILLPTLIQISNADNSYTLKWNEIKIQHNFRRTIRCPSSRISKSAKEAAARASPAIAFRTAYNKDKTRNKKKLRMNYDRSADNENFKSYVSLVLFHLLFTRPHGVKAIQTASTEGRRVSLWIYFIWYRE